MILRGSDKYSDELYGTGEDDSQFGLEQNDTLYGSAGYDYLDGGPGDGDFADYGTSPSAVAVVLTSTEGYGVGGDAEGDTLVNIECLVGSRYDDYLVGNDGDNFYIGGRAGNDIVKGGGGDDRLFGDAGNDTLKGGGAADELWGGIIGEDGYNDSDTAAYNSSPAGVFVSLIAGLAALGDADGDHLHSIENLTGSAFIDSLAGENHDNILRGMDGNDHLYGYDGQDTLDGGAGNDDMTGGRGSDTYVVDRYEDTVLESGGEGSDTVYARSSWAMTWGSDIERLEAFDPNSTAYMFLGGNNSANTIVGNHGDNFIDGGGGADVLIGMGGNDGYHVDHALDQVIEAPGEGNDTVLTTVSYSLAAGAHVETLRPYEEYLVGAMDLTGNEFDNTVSGNYGNNVISGGGGSDTLTGLLGEDVFLFNTELGADNVDRIIDFNVADDTIRLDHTIFAAMDLAVGNSVFGSQFVIGTAALDASDRIIYDNVSGSVWYDPDGFGGADQIRFATLPTRPELTNFDFFVVA